MLEVDDGGRYPRQLAQSRAILSYIGRELGLYPLDPFEAAKADEFCDTVEECVQVCLQASFGKEGVEQEAARRALADNVHSKLHDW